MEAGVYKLSRFHAYKEVCDSAVIDINELVEYLLMRELYYIVSGIVFYR